MITWNGIHYLQTRSEIFPATTGGAKEMCQELNVEFLGSLPLDPRLARCCDEGKDFINEFPESPAVVELKNIVKSKTYFVQKNIIVFNHNIYVSEITKQCEMVG